MARPCKAGLDYFSFDVDFFSDEKIVCISGEFGPKGTLATIILLCAIYRNGYYAQWNDCLKYKLKREIEGASAGFIEEVVKGLVRRGFFDKDLFYEHSVLTSKGIQRRYFEAAKFRKIGTELPYLLISEIKNYSKNEVSKQINPVSQQKTQQKKIKEIKVNKRSSSTIEKAASPSAVVGAGFDFEEFLDIFFEDAESTEKISRELGIADLRLEAERVIAQWKLMGHTPESYADASRHLISTFRKRVRKPEQDTSPRHKEQPQQPPSEPARKKSLVEELDAQTERRNREFVRRKSNAVRPDDYIRSMGYDPGRVKIWEVMNPDWRATNPPNYAAAQQTTRAYVST